MNEKNEQEKFKEELDLAVFNKTVKKTKRKMLLRHILISVIVTVVVGFGFKLTTDWLIQYRINKWHEEELFLTVIREPNVQVTGANYSYDAFKATARTLVTKKVGGRIIPWDKIETYIYPFRDPRTKDPSGGHFSTYNEDTKQWDVMHEATGNRVAGFFHPDIMYENLPNNMNLLSKMREDQYIEMAISFDQAYTLKEVENFFQEKHLNWLWLNSFSKDRIKADNETNSILREIPTTTGYGIPYPIELSGTIIRTLQSWKELQPDNPAVSSLLNIANDKKGHLKTENLQIIGVIISGEPSELLQYKDQPFVRASSLGATVDKY